MLTNFFYNLPKNEIFINGARHDTFITIVFGPLLWSWRILRYFIPRIWTILLLDQVSRHIYRNDPNSIEYYTRRLFHYLKDLDNVALDAMSINELSFTSLATRHLLRILSRNNKNSQEHEKISNILNLFITVMDKRLELLVSERFGLRIKTSNTEVATAIHSHNKASYRRYRFVKESTCWQVIPRTTYDVEYFEQFLETEIGEYTISTIERLIDVDKPATFYVMCSGGIDSMTLLRIFNGLRITNKYLNFTYRAIHINWHYRNESNKECEELKKLFRKWNVYYDIIDSPIDPEDPNWNKLSTDFRFSVLKRLSETKEHDVYFCLGHIITDLIENLFCNVCLEGSSTGKQNYFNLFGMQELGNGRSLRTANCTRSEGTEESGNRDRFYLFRPLLLHKKPNENDIPYFKDNATTIDIKRRVVRRLIDNFRFDESRIRSVYFEAYDLRQRYRISEMPFKYDKNWTMTEWREIFNNFGGLRKGTIKTLMNCLANENKAFNSHDELFRRNKEFRINSGKKVIVCSDDTIKFL